MTRQSASVTFPRSVWRRVPHRSLHHPIAHFTFTTPPPPPPPLHALPCHEPHHYHITNPLRLISHSSIPSPARTRHRRVVARPTPSPCLHANAPPPKWRQSRLQRIPAHCSSYATCGSSPTSPSTSACSERRSKPTGIWTLKYMPRTWCRSEMQLTRV